MTLEQQLAEAFDDVRRQNALRINRLRAIGTAAFTVAIAVNFYHFSASNWQTVLIGTTAYFAVALLLMIGGEANPRVLRASRFAVPVFDMPAVFVIQLANLHQAGTPGHVSEFTIAIFVCLLMLSAFTLNASQIYISLVLAIVFEQILQHLAEMGTGSRLLSVIVFCLATWICVFAGHNRLQLVQNLTRADARRRRLQRYFSPGVGELLEARNEDELAQGQECQLTVLFADIRSFTALSEHLTSREVVKFLNAFHARMVEAVFRQGGTLDKYLGDGLMAYFNAPVGQPDHAERAVQCALDMESELSKLNTDRWWHGHQPLHLGIGIHTGRAVVGDIGAPHRREFTAIGQAVNIASRLEQMTKELGVPVLVSEATASLVSEGIVLTRIGEFPVRGCEEPMRLLTPDSAHHQSTHQQISQGVDGKL